jgi:hypothetical protein
LIGKRRDKCLKIKARPRTRKKRKRKKKASKSTGRLMTIFPISSLRGLMAISLAIGPFVLSAGINHLD